jgi:hypothetical protein
MKSFTWTSKQKQASKAKQILWGQALQNPSIVGTLKRLTVPKRDVIFHFHMQQKLERGKRQKQWVVIVGSQSLTMRLSYMGMSYYWCE